MGVIWYEADAKQSDIVFDAYGFFFNTHGNFLKCDWEFTGYVVIDSSSALPMAVHVRDYESGPGFKTNNRKIRLHT